MSHVPDDRSFERSSEPLRDADAAVWRRVYLARSAATPVSSFTALE